jgi:hypothetical protein
LINEHWANGGWVQVVRYAPHITLAASAGLDGCIYLWDPMCSTPNRRSITTKKQSSIYSMALNPSGTLLLTGSTDMVVTPFKKKDKWLHKWLIKRECETFNVFFLLLMMGGIRLFVRMIHGLLRRSCSKCLVIATTSNLCSSTRMRL